MSKGHVIVTGGYGFIGSNFVNHFRSEFDKFIIIDKMTYAASLDNVHSKRLSYISYSDINDITNSEFSSILKSAKIRSGEPITIVNFAAESHVDNSIGSSAIFVETNVAGTHHLLELMLRRNGPDEDKFVQVSTDEVYGSIPAGSFYEESPISPNNPYSATKASADMIVKSFVKTHGMNACITRCCNNYGPNQADEKFIPVVLSCMLEGRKIPVYGNGENVREWIYVKDHCQAIIDVIDDGEPGEVYNIGSSEECSNLQMIDYLARALAKKTDKNPEEYLQLISFVEDRPGHDLRYSINCDKIRETIGWFPLINIQEGLESTVSYYVKKWSS